jgi:hypothetical protein
VRDKAVNSNNLIFDRAKESESSILTAIAYASKRYWGYPEEWMSYWRDALTITPAFIATNEVYTAKCGEDYVGFYALSKVDKGRVSLEHMWIVPEFMSRGYGRELFKCSLLRTLKILVRRIVCQTKW